jgi:hypothetical protein
MRIAPYAREDDRMVCTAWDRISAASPPFVPPRQHHDAAVGGRTAIEVSKIAGHATVSMTGDYTVVQLRHQEGLTRAIQRRIRAAVGRTKA